MSQSAQRARSAEAKEARIAAFLDAARAIAVRDGVREVTLTSVTRSVGLHPSALRRYFESTEELLLDLAQQGWEQWRENLLDRLEPEYDLGPEAAAALVAASLEDLPVFCDLLTHAVLSLEGAVRIERARTYKSGATAAYDAMTEALARSVGGLDRDGAALVLTSAMTSAAYLYQLSRPTPTLRELYAQEPRWAHSALRFREQLTELLTVAVRGARATTDGNS